MKYVLTVTLSLLSLYSMGQHIVLRDSLQKRLTVMPDMIRVPLGKLQVASIPQDQYTRCFGFFCRQELKMQRANIPVTFRLGSMELTNRLEGKSHEP